MRTQTVEKKAGPLFILLIVAIASGSTFASNVYLPSFPALAQAFSTSNSAIALTLTSYLLGFSLLQLLWGPASDRYGRQKLVITGLIICLVGSLFCAFTNSLTIFFIGRFLQGAGAASGMSLARSMARDVFEKEQLSKVFSWMGMLFAVSFAVAPIIGGYLQTAWGWRASFIFVAIYMLLMLILAIFYLHETNQNLNPKATNLKVMAQNYLTLLSSKVFMGYSLSYGLTWSGIIAFSVLSPFLFLNVMHMSAVAYGHLSIAITIGLIAASFINSSLVVKLGNRSMMNLGLGIMLISGVIMYAIGMFGYLNVLVVMAPVLIYIIGIGIVSANASADALTPFGHIAGVAGALYGCLQIFMSFIASSVMAHLPVRNQQSLAASLIVLAIGAILFYYFVPKPKKS